MSANALYILTDAVGYTTAVAAPATHDTRAVEERFLAESSRLNLLAPIRVRLWERRGSRTNSRLGWLAQPEWTWPHGA